LPGVMAMRNVFGGYLSARGGRNGVSATAVNIGPTEVWCKKHRTLLALFRSSNGNILVADKNGSLQWVSGLLARNESKSIAVHWKWRLEKLHVGHYRVHCLGLSVIESQSADSPSLRLSSGSPAESPATFHFQRSNDGRYKIKTSSGRFLVAIGKEARLVVPGVDDDNCLFWIIPADS